MHGESIVPTHPVLVHVYMYLAHFDSILVGSVRLDQLMGRVTILVIHQNHFEIFCIPILGQQFCEWDKKATMSIRRSTTSIIWATGMISK